MTTVSVETSKLSCKSMLQRNTVLTVYLYRACTILRFTMKMVERWVGVQCCLVHLQPEQLREVTASVSLCLSQCS